MSKLLNTLPVSLAIGLIILAYGLFVFLSNWSYSEPGHTALLIAYSIGSVLVFFAMRFSKIGFAILFVVGLFFITFYANQKFEWREAYISSAQAGRYFPMEQYIDEYPTYEQHIFSWALNTPRWIDFTKECYQPLIRSTNIKLTVQDINRHCRSSRQILEVYDVDLRSIIRNHYDKMKNTASLLNKGRLGTKSKFEKCIQDKKCVMIPLLPANVEVEQQSDRFLKIRKQFWSLINDETMSQENCNFFELCRIMTKADIVQFDDL